MASLTGAMASVSTDRKIRIEISPMTMVVAVLLIGAIWMLGQLVPVILVLSAALMIVGTFNPAVEWLDAHGFSRSAGIAIIFTALLLVLVALATLTLPALSDQVSSLIDEEPILRERLAAFFSRYRFTTSLADVLRNVQYAELLKDSSAEVLALSKNVMQILAYTAGAFFLALYIMIDSERLRGALFAAVPRSHHIRLSRVLLNLQIIVGGYLRGQAITCLCMGLFVFIVLTACGVQNALAFAVFGGLADVLPFVGIFLTMVPAVLAALTQGTVVALIVFVLLLCYEEFESRVLIPVVYGRALRLPSSVVFFALLVGGTLYGIVGALLALPLASAALMVVEELRLELPGEEQDFKSVEKMQKDARGEAEYERRTEGMSAEEAAAIAVEIADSRKKEEVDEQTQLGERAKVL
jgi:putative heme transporter